MSQTDKNTKKTSDKRNRDNENVGMSEDSNQSQIERNAQQMGKRVRTQTNRFGTTEFEENDDELFEEIHRSDGNSEATKTTDLNGVEDDLTRNDSSQGDEDSLANSGKNAKNHVGDSAVNELSIMSPGEKVIYRKLIKLAANVKIFQQGFIEIQTNEHKYSKTATIEAANVVELKKLGLPLQNGEALQQFDKDLQNTEFYTKVVC